MIRNWYNQIPYPALKTKREITKFINWRQFTKGTLSCHSNETTWATATKDIIYVETNVINMYAKFQLHPHYDFWGEDFWIIFPKFILYVALATNQIQRFGQNSYFGLLKKHFCRKKSKYLQWDSKNCNVPLFPLLVSGNYKLPQQPEFLSDWNKNTIIRSPHL